MDTPTQFNYESFIAELPPLIMRAKAIMSSKNDRRHDSAVFRQWEHEVGDLLQRISQLGYDINTRFYSRKFRAMSYTSTIGDDLEVFDDDLRDSVIEMELAVSRYEKYGDPKGTVASKSVASPTPVQVAPAAEPVKAPEKVTLAWLWSHVPVPLWGAALRHSACCMPS